MSRAVLDASALLAVLNGEAGAERLTAELLSDSAISTVNLAEIHAKLVARGGDPEEAWEDTLSAGAEAVPFTAEHAKIAGSLIAQTRALGLSLGDRACLALGQAMKLPIYTAERSWRKLKLGVRVHVIR